ncbi:MAG: efflux RND transporter periplasmic adaptor subunit [Bacteroidales bacterium]|nr:efflux RND transporter periplasmic adaptor subunit [Bacteroidales bacterium]
MNYKLKLLTLISLSLVSCGNKTENQESELQEIFDKTLPTVKVEVAKIDNFGSEILCNGRITADDFTDVFWQNQGIITEIKTRNGAYVNKGDVLAITDNFKTKNNFESAKIDLEQAEISFMDLIVGQGFTIDNVPENIKETAEIKSGLTKAKINYELCQNEYNNSVLIAPCSGVVANLENRGKGLNNTGKAFCRIINTKSMKVDFQVMESELHSIKIGSKVEVRPFAYPGEKFYGIIDEINPIVEANSIIKISAKIDNPKTLYDGMNVDVSVKQDVGKYISVNKSALVKRSNKDVVFVAKNNKAWWHYVTTGYENFERIVILDGIQEGDSVIVSDNINLADRSDIVVKND